MESENRVAVVEEEKRVIGVTTKENTKKEDQGNECNNGEEIQTKNEVSKPTVESESLNSAGDTEAAEAAKTSSPRKHSKRVKEPSGRASVASKNNKSAKDKPISKGTNSISQKQRATLSQSLSFPAKSAREDGVQKSIDGYPTKPKVKHVQGSNGTKPETSVRHLTKSTNSQVSSKEAKTSTGVSNQKTSNLTSIPSFKRSVFGRSTSVNAATKNHTSEAAVPIDKNPNPGKTAKPNKDDDDSHSTTSSATPSLRNTGSGFSFRLEERAEKRKEFFSKLEEKIQAKEAEKTNQQAKSKENQEAEIKQLRKSMIFKASPMPSFYKEPPPKVELKKIPTTRPRSPKLGRNKGAPMNNNNNNSEEDKPCSNPHVKQPLNDSTKSKGHNKDVISKKPIRKTQAKLHSQETADNDKTSKGDSARNVSGTSQYAEASTVSNEEYQNHDVNNNSECKKDISESDVPQNGEVHLNSNTPEQQVSYEVTVGV